MSLPRGGPARFVRNLVAANPVQHVLQVERERATGVDKWQQRKPVTRTVLSNPRHCSFRSVECHARRTSRVRYHKAAVGEELYERIRQTAGVTTQYA